MKVGWLATLVLACAATLLLGCGGPSGSMGKATGTVTVAGAPVADIVVNFTPQSGRPASGITDASGKFTASTHSAGDGAVPGTHKVSFSMKSAQQPPSSSAPAADMYKLPPPPPFNAKYNSPETSGITAVIELGKANEFKWDLEK
jgi:hypothetical protein